MSTDANEVALRDTLAAAEQGDAAAQNSLGQRYAVGWGVPLDYEQAVAWFRKAADQGDMGGQYNLGVSYADGLGNPQDDAQAIDWFRKAADQGSTGAEHNLRVVLARNAAGEK